MRKTTFLPPATTQAGGQPQPRNDAEQRGSAPPVKGRGRRRCQAWPRAGPARYARSDDEAGDAIRAGAAGRVDGGRRGVHGVGEQKGGGRRGRRPTGSMAERCRHAAAAAWAGSSTTRDDVAAGPWAAGLFTAKERLQASLGPHLRSEDALEGWLLGLLELLLAALASGVHGASCIVRRASCLVVRPRSRETLCLAHWRHCPAHDACPVALV